MSENFAIFKVQKQNTEQDNGDKEYTLYSDEIGRTPEEAVLNTVTN